MTLTARKRNTFPMLLSRTAFKVGSVEHPMLDAHYITFIALETEKGVQCKFLEPGEAPAADFTLIDDKAVTAYEYCNLHGLWKKDI